jgi:transcription elongation factor GreA
VFNPVSPIASFSATHFLLLHIRIDRQELKMEVNFLTPEGYQKLRAELEHLRSVRRPQVAEHIRIAREDGDLSENAGYDAAKEEQAHVEGRILTIEAILRNASIIEGGGESNTVLVGSKVTVREEGYDPEVFHIVGPAEVNPAEGRISNRSPLGRALLGTRVGDSVEVNTPVGLSTFTVLEIH